VRFEIDGFEVDFLAVEALDEQHRQVRTVLFDIDALGPAFDELNHLFLEGEGAPSVAFLSTWVTMTSALNSGDADAFTAAVPDHIRIVDHRPMGWPEMDRQQFIELMTAPDAMGRGITGMREIHRFSESGTVATGFTFVDSADAIAEPGWQYVILSTLDVGAIVAEFFAVDDLGPVLARFDELSGAVEPGEHEAWNDADRLARRLMELFADRSSDDWLDMLDPQTVAEERDPLLRATLVGPDGHRAAWTLDDGDRQLLSSVETIAVRGDRLALHRWQLHVDDGAFSWDVLRLTHWNDRDLVDQSIGFAGDDLWAALAELDRLANEEIGDSFVGDIYRMFSHAGRVLLAGDVDGYLAFAHPSFVMVDHRRIGWPELDIEGMRPRLESIVGMPGDVFMILERIVESEASWAACWVQRLVFQFPDGSEQSQRSIMVLAFDLDSGLMGRIDQFEEDRLVDALERLDELIAECGEVLVNRASCCWGAAHGLRRAGRPDLIAVPLGDNAVFVDERSNVMEPAVVEQRRLLAVRGELLALVEIRGRRADDAAIHSFAVEEIDEHGRLRSMTTFAADKTGLTGAANLLEQRSEEIAGSSSVLTAGAAWNRAHRARDADAMMAVLRPDLLLIDHRPLAFPTLDRDAVVALVSEQPEAHHGVLLTERIVVVSDRGLVSRGSQWQFGTDDQMTTLIPAYYVVTVRDGRIDRMELFPDDDPVPAIERLDELT
ncbi:hypothetical protein, partial [Ilumatobacter sp.]|uniref:hypothetical protein n=1 Tax=Ilumatobacter sp. TaxID=1967498 RepID=UPI003C4A879C